MKTMGKRTGRQQDRRERLAFFALLGLLHISLWGHFPPADAKPTPPVRPAARPAVRKINAGTHQSGKLSLESVQFFYRSDETARYLDLKTQYQSSTRGELPPAKAEALALEAFEKSDTEKPLSEWHYQGGPNPNVFLAKAHLYNQSDDARLHVTLKTQLRAKVGSLLVDPTLLLTDYHHLEETARWQTVSQQTTDIPAMSPGEETLVEVSRFELLKFLNRHPNQWPTELEVVVTCPEARQSKAVRLKLLPDHFVVPVLY